ncbi:MAG TPA: hypothetical protein VFB50_00520 [Chloroflexota bacterium]|nr:hypothetical protein [Chloroflexota bacterium]
MASTSADPEPPPDERDSGMSIEFALSIRYSRKRPDTRGDRFEARLDSVGLLIVGSIVTVILLVFLIPRILSALP